MASVSTHFCRYRATALGVAAAGSSLGLYPFPRQSVENANPCQTGGVCYPIILHSLFQRVGFGWGVRIDGFVGGVGCLVAAMLTTSIPRSQKAGPRSTVTAISDVRFVLLMAGSCLVALGPIYSVFNSHTVAYLPLQDSSYPISTSWNTHGISSPENTWPSTSWRS